MESSPMPNPEKSPTKRIKHHAGQHKPLLSPLEIVPLAPFPFRSTFTTSKLASPRAPVLVDIHDVNELA